MSDVDQYEAEAERTRDRISSTVEQLTTRLDPSTMIGSFRQDGSRLFEGAQRYVGEHPVALGLIGLSLGLLLSQRNRISGRSSYAFAQEVPIDYSPETERGGSRLGRGWSGVAATVGDARSTVAERAGHAAHAVREGAADAAGAVRARASSAADALRSGAATAADRVSAGAQAVSEQAGATMRAARDAAADLSHRARAGASRGMTEATEAVEDNPATAIAVGFAAGALIAFLLPGGDTRSGDAERFDRRAL